MALVKKLLVQQCMLLWLVLILGLMLVKCETNAPPIFTQVMNNMVLSENTPVGSVVYKLEGYDPEGSNVTFGSFGSDHFEVNPVSGNVTLIKALDREEKETLSFLVTIQDRVNRNSTESDLDNIISVPIAVIVLDENDNAPEFENTPYEADVTENAKSGTTIFDKIMVKDRDTVGESLKLKCLSLVQSPDACTKFRLEVLNSETSKLNAALVLNDKLNYNQRMIYHFKIEATDGMHFSQTNFEVRVKDIQDKPPVFQGALSAIIDEDSPINTLVLKIQARDGDTGEPRRIAYDLLRNPMHYFSLNEQTGELRTARLLDREALTNTTGSLTLAVRAREVIDGVASSESLNSTTTQVTVTLRDVNDSPPTFNHREFKVSLPENTPPGTPLALDMNVTDRDVGINSKFALHLDDSSGVFEVDPKLATSFSQVNVRVGSKTLDYENPEQRKFTVLLIAEETETQPKLSSTATITVNVADVNDNKPIFEQESYTATVAESAQPGQYIITITAHDIDSGVYGDAGIRYSISGMGSEYFNVNEKTGTISLADCQRSVPEQLQQSMAMPRQRREINDMDSLMALLNNNMNYTMHEIQGPTASGLSYEFDLDTDRDDDGLLNLEVSTESTAEYIVVTEPSYKATSNDEAAAPKTCLDYETESTYFLSYKATDDNGQGQTSVVSLRILVTDSNDSPPVCESPLYRASVDEGATGFETPLVIKARDADTLSVLKYSIDGSDQIERLFDIDKHTGEITIRSNASLDVTHLKTDHLNFQVEASDGIFSVKCGVNITVRDVNNHAPHFLAEKYAAVIEENAEIGTSVEKLVAEDLDTDINADIKYRIEHGSFSDFRIDEHTGEVFVANKLDYDRRNTYQMQILAADQGTPSLSGTATLVVSVLNSNDKDPYFTPLTQHADVREDAAIGTVVHTLNAIDPDVATHTALEFAGTDIIAIDKEGIELTTNTESLRDYFSIYRNGTVVVSRKLDRNLFAVLRINVLVADSTSPTVQQGKGLLTIQIVGVNKEPPRFQAPWTPQEPVIKLQIAEEQPIDTILTTLQAYDEDSTIGEYNISENDYFQVNRTTGVIRTIARIDYEKLKEIKFFASVSDTGEPPLTSTADVTVDIINLNDNSPHFMPTVFHFNVTENSPRGTVVGKVEAFDADLGAFGEIIYSLLGEYNKYFTIDAYTGNIMIADNTILDREKLKEIILTAVAHDKAPETVKKSATASIFINVLDVNDNAPVFTQTEDQYKSTVAENAALNPPAALLQVQAEDLDEGIFGDVRYIIIAGNEDGLFRLDPQTGILYPAQSLSGKKGVYVLTISARDTQGSGTLESTTKATIAVQGVNHHRPQFVMPALSNATIEIPGNIVKPEYLILTVKAIDNDTDENGEINYHLQVNSENVQETQEFKIDAKTGELRVKKELNRKERENYDIILVARDSGNPKPFETLRFLSISIVDANENRPEFPDAANPYRISINENGGIHVKVGQIRAQARSKYNKDVYYYMLLGNEDGSFYVDKRSGDIYTNKSLDRETTDSYTLYILASIKPDLHISEEERAAFSIKTLDRDHTVAKVWINVLDVNDNAPEFEQEAYYAGVNAKALMNTFIVMVNATDADFGKNSKIQYIIVASNLYKFGATKTTGSIVPSPFNISPEGRITTATFMAEYNQDRFELEILAREIEPPERIARTKVNIWIYDASQLVRVIISRSPEEVAQEQTEIIAELRNATQHRIIVDEIRFHVDGMGRIRMDWCDLFFHAVDYQTNQIARVDDVLKKIDDNYDYLRDYYAGFAIENVVPAYVRIVHDEFDLALAGLVALIIVLFVGVISFIVLCCCLKHWNLSVPAENRRKETLIKKQIIEDLNTTENPLWVEQKLKLYEEQELTMTVFSEPDHNSSSFSPGGDGDLRSSIEHMHQSVDNTYATIQPRNANHHALNTIGGSGASTAMHSLADHLNNDFADYATLRNTRQPSMYEFTGSTFQAPIREGDDAVAELI